jgi:hypothetical protein
MKRLGQIDADPPRGIGSGDCAAAARRLVRRRDNSLPHPENREKIRFCSPAMPIVTENTRYFKGLIAEFAARLAPFAGEKSRVLREGAGDE